jgi:hypothetical protein
MQLLRSIEPNSKAESHALYQESSIMLAWMLLQQLTPLVYS